MPHRCSEHVHRLMNDVKVRYTEQCSCGNDEVGPTNANGEVTLVKGVQIKNDKQVDLPL